jgi:hypothetical protein
VSGAWASSTLRKSSRSSRGFARARRTTDDQMPSVGAARRCTLFSRRGLTVT